MSQDRERRERLDPARRAAIERAARARLGANQVRTARAALKCELARKPRIAAYRHAARVIAKPPDWASTWPVAQRLASVRGLGSVRLAKGLETAKVDAGTPLGGLDNASRKALVAWLRAGARPH
jgi:hypothetical protein